MQASKELPTTRSRNRQFSQARLAASRTPRSSRSQIEPNNMSSSYIRKLDYTENKKQNRENTFNAQKPTSSQNRRHNRAITQVQIPQNSPSKLLCVGCFNHELAEAHRRRKTREKTEESRYEQELQHIQRQDEAHSRMNRSWYQQEEKKAKDYNKRLALEQQRKKEQQKQQRYIKQQEAKEVQSQNRRFIQEKARLNKEKRQRLRTELEQQIHRKRQHLERQKQESKRPMQALFDEPSRDKLRQQQQQHYRQQLLTQYQDDLQRKKQQKVYENMKKQEQARLISEQLAEKQKIRTQNAQIKRMELLQQARRRKQYKDRQAIEQRRQRQEQNQTRLAELEAETQVLRQRQAQKQNQVHDYLRDLKYQLRANETRKIEERQRHKQPVGFLLEKNNSIIERECDSCEKRYPEGYLTRVVEPFQL